MSLSTEVMDMFPEQLKLIDEIRLCMRLGIAPSQLKEQSLAHIKIARKLFEAEDRAAKIINDKNKQTRIKQ